MLKRAILAEVKFIVRDLNKAHTASSFNAEIEISQKYMQKNE